MNDKTWNDVFKTHAWGKYPSEDMIRFVAKNYYGVKERVEIKFLDLGCGIGTAAWYLSREGFDVTGVDGSEVAISQARAWFISEGLTARFDVAMLDNLPYPDSSFDVVVENCATTSNPFDVAKNVFNEVKRVLKPNGKYFGIFLGQETTCEGKIDSTDKHFFQCIEKGPLVRSAKVRLFSEEELVYLASSAGFDSICIDYAVRTQNLKSERVHHWLVTAS